MKKTHLSFQHISVQHVTVRCVLPVTLFIAASVLACSEDSDASPAPHDPPAGDAGYDVADVVDADVAPDADCPTCQWFPATCSSGALCTVNVTIEPKTVLLAIGAHGGSVTAVGNYGAVVDHVADAWRNGTVGTNDALRAVGAHGGELWAGSSLGAVFVRALGDSTASWMQLSAPTSGQNRPINGLVGDPQRSWAWAAITPVCAGGFFGDGVALVRLRKESTGLAIESVIRNDGFMSKCASLNAVDGTGDTIWAAGDLGALYEVTDLESASPRVIPENSATTRTLLSVWAEPTGHIWAAGTNATLVHRGPGGSFAIEELPTTVAIHAVRGTSASDVWAVGAEATALHFDGKTWSRVPIAGLGDRRPTLRAIVAVAPNRVWVAGDGVLLALAGADGGGAP